MGSIQKTGDAVSHPVGMVRSRPREVVLQALRATITGMRPQERLPTERELAALHGVSHSTIRRATRVLANEGLIRQVRGRGTFVAERPVADVGAETTVVCADMWRFDISTFFSRVLEGIIDEAARVACRVQVLRCCTAPDGGADVGALIEAVAPATVRGVLLPWATPEHLAALRAVKPDLRVVAFSGPFSPAGVGVVLVDRGALGWAGYGHLRAQGCRRIAVATMYGAAVAGARAAADEDARPAAVVDLRLPDVGEGGAAWLLRQLGDGAADGVLIDDDCLANLCFRMAAPEHPLRHGRCEVVTHANTGTDPFPGAARLVVDSYEVGAAAMTLVHWMIASSRSVSLTVRVRPRLETAVPTPSASASGHVNRQNGGGQAAACEAGVDA